MLHGSEHKTDTDKLDDAIRCLGVLESQRGPYWCPTVKIILKCLQHIKDRPSIAAVVNCA